MAKSDQLTPTTIPSPTKTPSDAVEGPALDIRDDRIAALEETVRRLEGMIQGHAVNAADAVQEAKSRREQEEWKKEVAKGTARLSQEAADRAFPAGKHRFRCKLSDGNGHPELIIGADTDVDASARYMSVCGITSAEKRVSVERA